MGRRGRPPKLSARQVVKAREWAGQGWTQQVIADRFGVSQSVVSELLARVGPTPVQEELPGPKGTETTRTETAEAEAGQAEPGQGGARRPRAWPAGG